MKAPLLSILTPSVPSRYRELEKLQAHIEQLAKPFPGQVEHLTFTDNKLRPVGAKRQALLDIARGDYIAFVDDDDWVSDRYLEQLLPRLASGPDVVTFKQDAYIDGVAGQIIFDATCPQDETWKPLGTARRRPWHVCAWRRSLALRGIFTEVSYYEDVAWVNQVAPLIRTHLHIDEVLHFYRHSAATTEAPPPLTPAPHA